MQRQMTVHRHEKTDKEGENARLAVQSLLSGRSRLSAALRFPGFFVKSPKFASLKKSMDDLAGRMASRRQAHSRAGTTQKPRRA